MKRLFLIGLLVSVSVAISAQPAARRAQQQQQQQQHNRSLAHRTLLIVHKSHSQQHR